MAESKGAREQGGVLLLTTYQGCRYWNPSEFSSDSPTRCMPPATRCIGGQHHDCSPEYTGEYCASCAEGFYLRDGTCLPCVPGEVQNTYAMIAAFVMFLNLLYFFAPPDLTRSVLQLIGVLKLFRRVPLGLTQPRGMR